MIAATPVSVSLTRGGGVTKAVSGARMIAAAATGAAVATQTLHLSWRLRPNEALERGDR